MMIALPNPDRSFTCTLFWPTDGTGSFASLSSPAAIERHFAQHYPDAGRRWPRTWSTTTSTTRSGVLGTVRCTPWQVDGRVGLLGDAAHAIVPFYGQGANCAFEDVVELDRCLDECGDDWSAALPLFQRAAPGQRRGHRPDGAGRTSWRCGTRSPRRCSRPGKRVEHALERALPGRYVSRYELVSFSTTPYAEVRRRVRRQHRVLGAVAAGAAALLAGAAGARSAEGGGG